MVQCMIRVMVPVIMCPFFYLLCKNVKKQIFLCEMWLHSTSFPWIKHTISSWSMILVKVTGVSPGKDKVCFSQDRDSHVEKWHPGSSWLVFLDDGIILHIQHWSLLLADRPGIQKQQLAHSWWDREHYIFLGLYTSATCPLYSHAHDAINAMVRKRGWLIITGQIILSICCLVFLLSSFHPGVQ